YKSAFISARQKTNIADLRQLLYEEVKEFHVRRYPYNSFLYDMPEDYEGDA
ncbi:MAG: GTPase HflX, partial [Bacteroidetes bacterium]